MKFIKDVKENKTLLLMALLPMSWYIIFAYLPMFGVFIAFQNFKFNKGFFGSEWIGFKNFEFLFKTADAFIITRNTVLYNLFFIVCGICISVLVAIMFDLISKGKLARLNQTIILFPHFLSWIVISYFVFAILNEEKGVLNQVITAFGGESVSWYTQPKYWPFILFVCHIWKTVGYSSIIYYANIKGFSVEYYEAARIDGANLFQQMWYITLPLLKSIVVLMFLLSIGSMMRSDFGLFYMIPRNSGLLYSVTSTIDTYIYNGMTQSGDMGATAAAGFYQSVVGFILVMISNGIVRKVSVENALF